MTSTSRFRLRPAQSTGDEAYGSCSWRRTIRLLAQRGGRSRSRVILLVRSRSTLRTTRASIRARGARAVVDTASERHVASRNLPLEIDLVGSFENRRVAVSGAHSNRTVDPAGISTAPSVVFLARHACGSGTAVRGVAPLPRKKGSSQGQNGAAPEDRGVRPAGVRHCRAGSWWTHPRRLAEYARW